MITIRIMDASEIGRIAEIDRAEEITRIYVLRDGALVLQEAPRFVPAWALEGDGPHSVAAKIRTWRPLLEQGGTMFGAFDGSPLVAFAIYRPDLSPETALLAFLQVSRPHRRRGIGAALTTRVIERARADGARRLYVSSAPTQGTVAMYRSLGWQPAEHVNEELVRLEPADIQMTLEL